MISIFVDHIPAFLRSGSFYESLDKSEQPAFIQVSESCYVANDGVNSSADLEKLIKVVAFWTLHSIPLPMIVFCDQTEPSVWREVLSKHEELDFAKALLSIFQSTTPLEKAIELGTTEVVNYLAQKSIGNTVPCVKAAEFGRVDYLSTLHRHGHTWNEKVCEKAAANGHLQCLKYLHEKGCPWNNSIYTTGQLHCVEYALEQGLQWNMYIAEMVAESGNLDVLQFLIEHNCPVDGTALALAAEKGRVDCLKYLLDDVHLPVNFAATEVAAMNCHLDCLQLLHQRTGTTWMDALTMAVAARNGHVHIVQYLHEIGCPWDERAADSAACKAQSGQEVQNAVWWGNHYVLQYLIDQGCPYMDCRFEKEESFHGRFMFSKVMGDEAVHPYDCNLVECLKCLLLVKWNVQ
eukprot:gene14474-16617_t